MTKALLFCFLGFLVATSVVAQSEREKVGVTLSLKITSVEKAGTDRWKVTTNHGKDLGLKTGDVAEAWGIVRSDIANHNVKLGEGTFITVDQNSSAIVIVSTLVILPGDQLYQEVQIPSRPNRSPYFQLQVFGITITDQQGKPYYTLEEIIEKDGYALRTEKFLAMKAEINDCGSGLQQKGDKKRVEAGPHKNELVADILQKTDTSAVWTFISYEVQNYMESMGQTMKLCDTYLDYVTKGDRISSSGLKELFLNNSREKWDKKYEEYERQLPVSWSKTWKEEAIKLREKEEYENARTLLSVAEFVAGKHDDKNALAECVYEEGELFFAEKNYTSAAEQFSKARNLFGLTSNSFGMAQCDYKMGMIRKNAKQLEEALSFLKSTETLLKELLKKSPAEETYNVLMYRTNNAIAEAYNSQKRYDLTLTYYTSNVELCHKNSFQIAEAYSNWALASTLSDGQGKNVESLPYYERSAVMYLEWQDTVSSVDVRFSKATILENLEQYQKALDELKLALTITGGPDLRKSKIKLIKENGRVFRKMKSYVEALNYFNKAKTMCHEDNDFVSESYILKEISLVYQDQNQFDTAAKYLKDRLPLVEESSFDLQADVYWDLAYLNFESQKDYKSAIGNYQKSVDLYSVTTDTSNWKTVLCNLAAAYRNAGDSVNCYKTHATAVALTLHNSDYTNLTYVYRKASASSGHFKNYRKKIDWLTKEFAIHKLHNNYSGCGDAAKQIAKCYEEEIKEIALADQYYRQSIAYFDKTEQWAERGDAYWNLAYNQGQNQKKYKEAIANYEIAFGLYLHVQDSSNASVVRSNVGQTYWSMNNFDKAIESHKEAIELATKSRNQRQIFKSWNALADLYKNTGNPIASADALRNASVAVEKLNDSTLVASTYLNLASSYSNSKNYVRALEYNEKSLKIYRAGKDSLGIASTLSALAAMYQNKGEFPKSVDYYNQSLVIRRAIHDKQGEVYDISGLGVIAQSVDGNYRKAESYFQEAILLCIEVKNDLSLAFIYNRLNYLYRAEGKSKKSEEFRQKAEDIYRKNGNWKELADLTVWKGFDAFYNNGDQIQGQRYLDLAQSMADTLNDKTIQSEIYDVRSSLLRESGEFDKALEYTDKGLKLYQELDNEWGILSIYVNKGNILKQRGEYETALRYQFKADSMCVKLNSENTRAVTAINIGENYAAQGDYDKALENYQRANAIFEKTNEVNENVAYTQGLIGQSYFFQNKLEEADKWLKLSLVTCERSGAMRSRMDNLSTLGRLKIAQKKYEEAYNYLSEGVRLSKEKANTLTYLNNLLMMGKLELERKNYAQASGPLEESVKSARSIGKNTTLWEGLYLLGLLYKNTGDLPKSKEYLKESVAVIEKIRNNVSGGADAQKLFSSDKSILNVYDALIEVLLALGETEEAMTYLQKNNADNLKTKFKTLDIKFEDEKKNKAVSEERSKKAKLDGIEQQIAAEKLLAAEKQNTEKLKNLEGIKTIAENEYLKFINQQINVQPELSKYFNNTVQPTQFRKVKNKIPKDMALVSYLAGENQLYIFAATSDTVIAKIVTVPRARLTKDITAMLNIVRSNMGTFAPIDLKTEVIERQESVMAMKQTDESIKPFEDAYHYLIAPVSKEIAGKSRLCIIPTGSLNYIPFQLLGKTLANGKFSLLMNQFSIFYANSTDMLFREENESDKQYKILAFGNPDKSLPSTEREVNDIKKMFPSASIFLREEATEDKAKFASESFNVMHFATHGNLDYEDFSKSFLTMAGNPAKNEDGMLTLEELWGMEVMNHLNIVVLSACQTAVTKGSNESSPVSPASGFLQNGVKSVVATLWKVDDEATSLLMSDFYSNLKKMDAVDALRAAQVNLSRTPKFNHPYYWAAVVLLGDWR